LINVKNPSTGKMNTQKPLEGIPLSLSDPLQNNLRLLELPPELVDVCTAPEPPRYGAILAALSTVVMILLQIPQKHSITDLFDCGRLYFKSAPPSASPSSSSVGAFDGGRTGQIAGYLHLCTPTQSFQVRQVSTSNSVYVIQPSSTGINAAATVDEGDGTNGKGPPNAITAIAKIDTLLELVPTSHDVQAMLRQALPIINIAEASLTSTDNGKAGPGPYHSSHSALISKAALFANLPAPDLECELAWRDLLAFEVHDRCSRPTASSALIAWRSLLDHAILNHLDLARSALDLRTLFADGEDSFETAVTEAVLGFLQQETQPHPQSQPLITPTSHLLRLDRPRTVRWTGTTLLQSISESEPGSISELDASGHSIVSSFISQWRDLLPESWRHDACIDELPRSCYEISPAAGASGGGGGDGGRGSGKSDETGGRIRWSTRSAGLGTDAGQGTGNSKEEAAKAPSTGAAATTAGKRKWHEKFKAQRKEVRK
jgi:sister chromatid cohesion protein DCC1